MTRRFSVWLLFITLVITALSAFGTAQSSRRPLSPLQNATRALLEGRYDDVESLTEKLDARDATVVAVRARADIARGRHAQAEAALRPVASRAPTSEAALELGLLQQMLSRNGAASI